MEKLARVIETRSVLPETMTRSKRKICVVTPEFPPDQWGGLARTVDRVARHIRDMGLEVHVAHFTVFDEAPVFLDENRQTRETDGMIVHSIRVGREELAGSGRELWDCPHNLTLQMMYQSLEMLHAEAGFEVLHSFFLYPVGYVVGLLARRLGIPSIVTIVGNDVKKYFFSPEKVAVCRSGLDNADRVVALSQDLADMANALTSIDGKYRIIYNSVEIPRLNRSTELTNRGKFRIGCAGIFKYAKGLPYLFRAVARISRQRDVNLELVGQLRESEKETFNYILDTTGIKDVLSMIDPLPHDLLQKWIRSLDVFVLPSLTEGCPNVLMEAMAGGVPVIATRTGAADVLVEDQVSGLLVPWGHPSALASAIFQIMDNPVFAESLGKAGRIRMKRFSPEMERQSWESVYREFLEFKGQ